MSKITKEWLWKNDWYSWMKDNYFLPNKEKYTFKGYEYLLDIVKRPWNPGDQLYIKKSSQCGASELAIAWCLWLMERCLKGFSGVGYLFPAKTLLNDHMKARVFPILEMARFMRNTGISNLGLIKYRNIPWYFRSGNSRALKGWPASAIAVDEFDEYEDPIKIIPSVEARFNAPQTASKYAWIFGLSTPTHPNVGIDRAAEISTQYNWYVTCPKCSKKFSPLNEVILSGFDNCVVWVTNDKAGFLCPHCREPVQPPGLPGQWEKDTETTNQKYSYSISRLFLESASLEKMLNSYEEALNIQEFYNSDLGLPYSPPNSRLTRANIMQAALGDIEIETSSSRATWMGMDVGKPCHYLIGLPGGGKLSKVISYGTCNFDQIESIITRFNVKTMVIDLRPEENSVKNLIKGRRGFYACDFNTGSNQIDWYNIIRADSGVTGAVSMILKAQRTESCDKVIENVVVTKKMIFPGKVKGDENFIAQMCAPMRIDGVDKKTGDVKSFYKSTSRKDHYFFACVYLNLAFNLRRGSFAKLGPLLL